MKTLQDQYRLIKEGKGHKGVFLKEAKTQFPQYIRNASTFDETTLILKDKGIINENIVGVGAINSPFIVKEKESYETAFEKYLGEAKKKEETKTGVKAVEKQTSQEVENILSHNYDQKDNKDINNLIFDQVMTGYYAEMKDPKNADKTMEELKSIVCKNLEKDPIYYTKNGQFGVKDLGYETEVPGLGTPKEPKGPYKSSGYGTLKEDKVTKSKLDESHSGLNKDFHSTSKTSGHPNPSDLSVEEIEAYIKANPTTLGGRSLSMWKMVLDQKKAGDLKESHQPGDKVIYKGTRYEVVDEDEFIITLKDENGKIIKQNYNQFKQGETTPKYTANESKLRKVINTLIREELDKNYDKNNNILYLNRVKDAIASNGKYEYDEDALSSTLDNPTRAKLLSAANALDVYNMDLYSLVGKYDEDIINTLEGIFKQVDDEFYSDFTDPAGGSGLASHLQETKLRKVINTLVKHQIQENVQKELQQIDKEAQFEILASKLEKIEAAVEKRQSQLDRLDEDEDLKNLTDKKKLKALAKDIKVLEKAKSKIEKILSKKDKSEMSQPEIIDDGMIDEADGDVDDAKTTADEMERAAAAAKEIGDTELFEEDEDEISESKI